MNNCRAKSSLCWWQCDGAALILLAIGGLLFSYPVVMSTLAPYDDEGYVMMTLQSFHGGHRLYGETHTQYGPAFYFLTDSLHHWFRVPLSQDGVRLKTIIVWCLASIFCYAVLRRNEVSKTISLLIATLFHLHLDKLALEPGHPQEWILLLSVLAIWFVGGQSSWRWSFAAACAALVGLTKINCGAIVAIPLFAQAILVSGSGVRDRFAWLQVLLAGIGTTVFVIILTIASGTSPSELAWGLIGQHQRFSTDFYLAIPWNQAGLLFAALSIFLMLPILNSKREFSMALLTIVALTVAMLGLVFDIIRPLIHGLEPRGAAPWLVVVGPALVPWMVRFRSHITNNTWMIAGIVILSPLMAFPTPGTQMSLATATSWIVIGLLLDSCSRVFIRPKVSRWALRSVSIACALWILANSWYRYASNESLDLAGARLLRLESSQAIQQRRIAKAILETHCDQLAFDAHTHNRFYFWTGCSPLTHANPTFWTRMLTSQEQQKWVESLGSSKTICVVLPPENEALATNQTSELRCILLDGWIEQENIDGWRIGIRKLTP